MGGKKKKFNGKREKNEFFISLIHNPKKIPFLHAGTFPTRSVVPDHVIERRIIAEEYIKKKIHQG
jgi:hypothetical protein